MHVFYALTKYPKIHNVPCDKFIKLWLKIFTEKVPWKVAFAIFLGVADTIFQKIFGKFHYVSGVVNL